MICIIFLCICLSLTTANVIPEDAQAKILDFKNTNDGVGNYEFSYKTSNGITREEAGHLVNVGQENEHLFVRGSYSYTDTDGKFVIIYYTADENGFKVKIPGEDIHDFSLPPSVVATLLG